MKEKRQFKRVDLDVVINFSQNVKARAINISEGGIRIVSTSAYEIKKIITMVFSLPGEEDMKIFGMVKWRREVKPGIFECGIEFWHLNTYYKKILRKYIEEKLDKVKK